MKYTQVGNDKLPELPWGWPVAVDTESSGLYLDGDPIPSAGRPAQPEARVSVVSVSFRQPIWNEEKQRFEPGELLDFAWPFDQGPVLGKPGKPIKDPVTGVCTFAVIDKAEQDRILAAQNKVLGRGGLDQPPALTTEDVWNWGPDHYERLISWLDRRNFLEMHNSVHDMHIFRGGLRKGAGGYDVEDGTHAWNPDSEPGQWVSGTPQNELLMMEPTNRPLKKARGRRYIWCTMVCQKQLIDPIEIASLKPTAMRLWGEEEADEQAQLKIELSKMGVGMTKRYDLLMWGAEPWSGQEALARAYAAMGRYAAKDTNLTHRLQEYQVACVEEDAVLPDFWRLMDEEMELRTTLYRMECRGVAYNVQESLKEGKRMRLINKEKALELPFDPTKPMQAKRYYFGPVCQQYVTGDDDGLFAHPKGQDVFHEKNCLYCGGTNGLGLTPESYTDKGAPQLDIVSLRNLEAAGHPFAKEYMEWTKRRNADSKWYTGWAVRTGRDGRIRTSFKQCTTHQDRPGQDKGGTKSGRLAATRWGAQQIPKKRLIPEGAKPVRGLIGDEPGYKLYEHDLATGEMRVAVVLAGCYTLWDALDAGADTHTMNAKALFGVTEEHPKFKMYRDAGKGATFCILYGGGETALIDQLEGVTGEKVHRNKAREVKNGFFQAYPEFKTMTNNATAKVSRYNGGPGYLTMLDGWRRVYGLNEKSNSAVNQAIQGNLARACNRWMRTVERELPGVLLLQIHDSLITRHTDDEKGRAEAQRVSDIGNRVFEDYFNVRGRLMTFGIEPDEWSPDK